MKEKYKVCGVTLTVGDSYQFKKRGNEVELTGVLNARLTANRENRPSPLGYLSIPLTNKGIVKENVINSNSIDIERLTDLDLIQLLSSIVSEMEKREHDKAMQRVEAVVEAVEPPRVPMDEDKIPPGFKRAPIFGW